MSVGHVYLLHFHQPYRHCRHYIGFTAKDINGRIEVHRAGKGARLMEVVVEAGIDFDCVRIWFGGRKLERRLKNRKHADRLCPVCRAKAGKTEGGVT